MDPKMQYLSPKVFWLRATCTLLFSALLLLGCASDVKRVDLDPSTSPTEETARLDEAIKAGYAEHYDILAPDDFEKAQKELAEAKEQIAKTKGNEKILATLGKAHGWLNRAKERSNELRERVQGILEARSAALKAGVRRYPRLSNNLKRWDDELRERMPAIEDRKLTAEKWAALQIGYQDLELLAIQHSKVGNAQAKIEAAIKNGARTNTPRTLERAEFDLQNAKNVISANRHSEHAYQAAVDKANTSATFLTDLLAVTKRGRDTVSEDVAIDLVNKNRKLAQLNEQLGATTSQIQEKSSQLAQQGEQLKSAGATLRLQEAMEKARKEFNPDEAEVYQQGDKLLIRLKAVNFPSGRADLPADALPLLAKVKNVAEELNPEQVTVEGHTDSVGSAAINQQLSQNRAEAVTTYFANNGIEREKLAAIGQGYKKPIVTNKTKLGRAQNRRVDVIITPAKTEASSTM